MTSGLAAGAFRARSSRELVWRLWGEEYVLFDTASGDTHLLDRLVYEGISALQSESLDPPGLARALAVRFQIDEDADLRVYATKLLCRLDELGLVDPVP